MRKLLATQIQNDSTLTAKWARRFYSATALGRGSVPANPKKPFGVYREIDVAAVNVAKDTRPNMCRRVIQIYVHDERGSYTRIDQIIGLLRETVRRLVDQGSDTEGRCLEVEWNGTSGDSEDPTYDTAMKFVTFTLTSTQ